MSLVNILKENKKQILDEWFELLAKTYPRETAQLMIKKRKSLFKSPLERFQSPAEYLFVTGLERIFDAIIKEEVNWEEIEGALDDILRLRSIQDFTPSRAVSFVFFLKGIIKNYAERHGGIQEFLEFEMRIDALACKAFDIYMQCREDLYERRVAEVKALRDMAMKALERAGVAYYELEKQPEELRKKH